MNSYDAWDVGVLAGSSMECRSRLEREPLWRRECAGAVVARWGARCNAAGSASLGEGRRDEADSLAEGDGGLMKREASYRGPEIQGVAVGMAGEAVIGLASEMDREGPG